MSDSETGSVPSPAVQVLIGFAEALSAPEVAWSLVDAGFHVVAFARRGRGCALRSSRYVRIHEITPPEVDATAAGSDLSYLLQEQSRTFPANKRVLFPLDDSSVWLSNTCQLGSGWIVCGPTGARATFALDKRLQIAAAQAVGLNIPHTDVAERKEDILSFSPGFPLILKPAQATHESKGKLRKGSNWICGSQGELEKAMEQWGEQYPLLVQPFLQGHGEGIFGLATESGVKHWSAHRRIRMMNPHGSGSSACKSQVVDESLKQKISDLVLNCGWRGLFMVELLRRPSGEFAFIEFNGRPWGSMALARRQGLEYPAWAINDLLKRGSIEPESSPNLQRSVMCRNVAREIMHLLFVLRGPKSKAIRDWPSLAGTVRALFSFPSRCSIYNWRKDDLSVFLFDCCYTFRDQIFKAKR